MPGNRSDRLTARPLWQSPPSFYLALAPPVSPVGVSSVAGNRYPLSPTRGVFFSRVAFRGEVVSHRRPVGNRSGSGRGGARTSSGRSHGLRATRSRASRSDGQPLRRRQDCAPPTDRLQSRAGRLRERTALRRRSRRFPPRQSTSEVGRTVRWIGPLLHGRFLGTPGGRGRPGGGAFDERAVCPRCCAPGGPCRRQAALDRHR